MLKLINNYKQIYLLIFIKFHSENKSDFVKNDSH
jgi:hypothetical protein